MRDLTPNEIGSLLFSIKGDLEVVSKTLTRWRNEGIGPGGMVPLSVIVAESKVNSTIVNVEDLIQILTKISSR
jgi:hypothetical protein